MDLLSTPIAMAVPLLTNLPVGLLLYEGDTGECVLANQAVADMFGESVEALRRQRFDTLAARCHLAESTLRDGLPGRHEVTMQTAAHRTATLDLSISRFDFEGNPHLLCTITDITERKRLEEEREERYRLVFENSPVSIWEEDFSAVKMLLDDLKQKGVTDIEAYFDRHPETVRQCAEAARIVDVNRAALDLHGAASKAELLAGLVQTFTPESFETFRRELVCLWQGGIEMVADAAVKTLAGERREVTVYFSVCPGHEQTLSRVVVSLVDITERKQAEQSLRENERLLRTLINSTPDIICFKDGKGRWLEANDSDLELFCLKDVDYRGKTDAELSEFTDPIYRSAFLTCESTDEKAWQAGGISRGEEIIPRPDGTQKVFDVIKAPVFEMDGSRKGLVVLGRDITERKRIEEELCRYRDQLEALVRQRTAQWETANRELEGFTYSVSHDLRAPLRHIDGFVELLARRAGTALDQESRHCLDAISEAAHKMGLLVDDLLAFSRLGRRSLSIQAVDLGTLVEEVMRELGPDAAGRTIAWQIGELPRVKGDAAMLRIVLTNLIANALKFTRPRERAQIEIGRDLDQGTEDVIFVRDNGVGFDMAYGDKLFGVFQRLHRADEFEGTGIGLANVRRIVTRHGGRTWAEGKIDQGATVYFSLPKAGGAH